MAKDADAKKLNDDQGLTGESVEAYSVLKAVAEAQDAQLSAAEDILDHTQPTPVDAAAVVG